VTNQELADSVNINLYNATRILSEWQKSGAIFKHGGKIVMRSPKKIPTEILPVATRKKSGLAKELRRGSCLVLQSRGTWEQRRLKSWLTR
jgi:hypothetical protein